MPLRPALKIEEEGGSNSASSPFPFASSARIMLETPRVHFPPTPTLTSTALTHAPSVYDRAPIRVAQNTCALPERNARTYFAGDTPDTVQPKAKESYFAIRRGSQSTHRSRSMQTPSPLDESDTSDSAYGSYGSPSPVSNLSSHFSARRLSVSPPSSSSDDPFQQYVTVDNPPGEFSTARFSLLPPTPEKHRSKSGLKKKREQRLQAGAAERRRTSYITTTSSAYDDLCNPALAEGCLGGF